MAGGVRSSFGASTDYCSVSLSSEYTDKSKIMIITGDSYHADNYIYAMLYRNHHVQMCKTKRRNCSVFSLQVTMDTIG